MFLSLIILLILNYRVFGQNGLDHTECTTFNQQALILSTLNGNISGVCLNLTLNYASQFTQSLNNLALAWLSIPYAEPPVNKLRFLDPKPTKQWNDTLVGNILPNRCIQSADFSTGDESEDCLYLNIFTPYNAYVKSVIEKNTQTSLLPIFVWIHGGAFTTGSSSIYDATILSIVSNMIVVTINYRLGIFGFLHLKDTDAKGNQAILDQYLALKWVYDNAAKFGGDKTRITLGGESAGSWSVGYHLLYKPSWPFFRNAILQSGSPVTIDIGTRLLTSDQATNLAINISSQVSCSTNQNNKLVLDCLQQVDYSKINSAAFDTTTFPIFVLDSPNQVFDRHPRKLFETGSFKNCSILMGTNNFEEIMLARGELGSELFNQILYGNMNSLRASLKKRLSINDSFVDQIINAYIPPSKMNDITVNYLMYFSEMITDFQYRCPTNLLAAYLMKYNRNAYVYLYGHKYSLSKYAVEGAVHADELSIVFGWLLEDISVSTKVDRALSEKVIRYWSSFVSNDKPSLNNEWLKFNEKYSIYSRSVMFLKNDLSGNIDLNPFNDLKCLVWNNLRLM